MRTRAGHAMCGESNAVLMISLLAFDYVVYWFSCTPFTKQPADRKRTMSGRVHDTRGVPRRQTRTGDSRRASDLGARLQLHARPALGWLLGHAHVNGGTNTPAKEQDAKDNAGNAAATQTIRTAVGRDRRRHWRGRRQVFGFRGRSEEAA